MTRHHMTSMNSEKTFFRRFSAMTGARNRRSAAALNPRIRTGLLSTKTSGGMSNTTRYVAFMAVPGAIGIGAYMYLTDDFELRSRQVTRRALNEHLMGILGEGTRLSGFIKKEQGNDRGLVFWIEGPEGRAHVTVRGNQSVEYLCVRPHGPDEDRDMLILVDLPPLQVSTEAKKPRKEKKKVVASTPQQQIQESTSPDPSSYSKETVFKTMGVGLVIGVMAGWLYVNRFRRTPMQSMSGTQNHLRTAHNLISQSTSMTRVLGNRIKTNTSSDMKMSETQLQASFALNCEGSEGEGTAIVAAIRTSPEDDWLYHIHMNFPGRTKKLTEKFYVEDGASEAKKQD